MKTHRLPAMTRPFLFSLLIWSLDVSSPSVENEKKREEIRKSFHYHFYADDGTERLHTHTHTHTEYKPSTKFWSKLEAKHKSAAFSSSPIGYPRTMMSFSANDEVPKVAVPPERRRVFGGGVLFLWLPTTKN